MISHFFCAIDSNAAASVGSDSRNYDIPAGEAIRSLRMFSQQSGEQILYPADQVRGQRTHALRGTFTPREALQEMLENTDMVVVEDPASGALVIRLINGNGPDLRERSEAQVPMTRHVPKPMTREMDDTVVVLSSFEVRSRADTGYKAANSVSATGIAVPIRQLPMSVSAYTEDFITDQKAYDLYDIVKWAPGVHQDNVSPQGWVRYNIRGFTSAAVQRNGFGSFRFIDTTNVARVEVVKGPASLLYGQINPGGVINYITKRPEKDPRVLTTATIGDRGYKRFVVDATGPIGDAKRKVFYRAIAMAEDIQQFQAGAQGRKYMVAPSFTWRLADRTAITVDYEHFERLEDMLTSGVVLKYVDGIATAPYPGLPWDFSYAGEGDYQDFVSDALTVEFTTQLGDSVNLRASYLDSYWDMEWRATGQGGTGLLAQSFIDPFYPATSGLTPIDAMFRRNRWEHQWGGERTMQVDATGDFELGALELRALVSYKEKFSTRLRSIQKNNPNVAGSPFYLKPWDLRDPSTWSRAVPFGIESLVLAANNQSSSEGSSLSAVVSAAAFNERLRLLGGYARHELVNAPTLNFVAGTATPSTRRAANVPQAGALFEIISGVTAFASYSESFLANTNMLRVNNVPTRPAEPSVGKGLEAGLKLDLWEGRLSGTVSAYRIRASPTGIIVVTTGVDATGTTLFTDVQGGTQLSEGFEFDLLFTPIEGLQMMMGYSHSDAVYERHPTNEAFNGTRLVATPERTFSVWTRYAIENGWLSGATLSGGFNYVGSMAYIGNNPQARTEPYLTLDLSCGYRFAAFGRNWNADLSIKNVTDEHYYSSASSWGFPRHTMISIATKF
jgi:iron complex outermembrane recepter protein